MTSVVRHRAKLAVVLLGAVLLALISAPQTAAVQTSSPPSPPGQGVYFCPMHPDVRGKAGDKCPLCGMSLVRATAADYAAYVLEVETVPRVVRPQQKARVRFFVRDPRSLATVKRFDLVHERVFHLFVISQDLAYFRHIHPTLRPNGSLDVEIELPRAGVYQLIADFMPEGGSPQLLQKSIVTAGYTGPLVAPPALTRDTDDKIVSGARVKLTMPEPVAGREQLVTFDLEDAATARPLHDLEPYLGAVGHLLLVSADLSIASHSHPVAEISSAGGPTVVFQMMFPRAGEYRMWVQFQRHGEVLTAAFTVPVKEQ